ncbi:6670_t:CDS:2 [Cetraspora pellucida]|uniref:6670_t:CDS:1 n=1 Tax=Cetraspora pellucida TaxID=1433469 RepID=A0A9N8VS94_9GLOM|nr:6670_t:CDS:2 [Cetraspora pellucida]
MSINKMLIPLDDISSDNEPILSNNSFFDEENFFENNSFNVNQEEDFLEKNSSFNAIFENFDIDNIFEDDKFSLLELHLK